MTCIVGLLTPDGVLLGGDSAATSGAATYVRKDPKVFRSGLYVFGAEGSWRQAQIVHHAIKFPPPQPNLERFMSTTFIDALRDGYAAGGVRQKKDEVETASSGGLLVGIKGRLFRIHGDFQVAEFASPFTAIGSGRPEALGALFANAHLQPRQRVRQALRAAAAFDNTVCGPFRLIFGAS